MISPRYDLAIIGGGPAGTAAALTAADAGWRVCVIAGALLRRGPSDERVGESLSPAARPLLSALGLWSRFESDQHAPCYGNASAWGEDRLRRSDSLCDPQGNGWHLDRGRFDAALVERLAERDIPRYHAVFRRAQRSRGRWQLALSGDPSGIDSGNQSPGELAARWVIDAGGRGAPFARCHGARRRQHDKQQALIAWLEPDGEPLRDRTTLVETVSDGWWYSAVLPDGRLIAAFFAQPGAPWRSAPGDMTAIDWWQRSWRSSQHTARRLRGYRSSPTAGLRLLRSAAGSARLDRFSGEGWLAAGDAALSCDPLCAHGITIALASGRDGARAVLGGLPAVAAYEQRLAAVYRDYLKQLRSFYLAEGRWPASAYWQARRRSFA